MRGRADSEHISFKKSELLARSCLIRAPAPLHVLPVVFDELQHKAQICERYIILLCLLQRVPLLNCHVMSVCCRVPLDGVLEENHGSPVASSWFCPLFVVALIR